MQTRDIFSSTGAVTLGLVLLAGCGAGNTAPVTGTVTMDGVPLENATVVFLPQRDGTGQGGGRPAAGKTDGEGRYKLIYGRGTTGAVPGDYRVEIRTYLSPDPDAETPEEQQGAPERVPSQFNADSTLFESVDAGGNEINFDLVSEGEIKLPEGGYGGGY